MMEKYCVLETVYITSSYPWQKVLNALLDKNSNKFLRPEAVLAYSSAYSSLEIGRDSAESIKLLFLAAGKFHNSKINLI